MVDRLLKMNISFQDFSPNIVDKDHYEYGVDYLSYEFNLELEDAFHLLTQLKNNKSNVIAYAPSTVVDFYIFDNMLCVQIDSVGFWHQTNISLEVAKKILKATFEGCEDFGSQIPGTSDEWECYTL